MPFGAASRRTRLSRDASVLELAARRPSGRRRWSFQPRLDAASLRRRCRRRVARRRAAATRGAAVRSCARGAESTWNRPTCSARTGYRSPLSTRADTTAPRRAVVPAPATQSHFRDDPARRCGSEDVAEPSWVANKSSRHAGHDQGTSGGQSLHGSRRGWRSRRLALRTSPTRTGDCPHLGCDGAPEPSSLVPRHAAYPCRHGLDREPGRRARALLREMQERMSDPAVYNDHTRGGRGRAAAEGARGPVQARRGVARRSAPTSTTRATTATSRELVPELEQRLAQLEEELKLALVETDPADRRTSIVEIRQGVGGDEAALWAGDLYRMLTPLRRAARLQDRGALGQPERRRRLQGGHLRGQGRRRVLGVQVGGRHAPRAARARDRVAGPHPHVDRDGRGDARGRGGRGRDRRRTT